MNAAKKDETKESFNLVPYKAIADGFSVIQMAETNRKELTASISEQKIKAYCLLISTFNTEKLTKKSQKAGAIRIYLENNGISPASAKRYMEIGQAARQHFNQTNPLEMREAMQEKDINSESDLKTLCFGATTKTIEEKLIDLAKSYIREYDVEYSKTEIIQDWATACKQALEEGYKEKEKKTVVAAQKGKKNNPTPDKTKEPELL